MSRAPIVNPYLGEDDESRRAWEQHTEEHERRADQASRIFTTHLTAVAATATYILIPRVPAEGFEFGRVTYTFTADLAMDGTDYWTFALYRRHLEDGVSVARPITNGSWTSSEIGMTAFRPYSVEYKQPLDPGEVLVLVVTKAASGATFTACVQTQEIYGPEE